MWVRNNAFLKKIATDIEVLKSIENQQHTQIDSELAPDRDGIYPIISYPLEMSLYIRAKTAVMDVKNDIIRIAQEQYNIKEGIFNGRKPTLEDIPEGRHYQVNEINWHILKQFTVDTLKLAIVLFIYASFILWGILACIIRPIIGSFMDYHFAHTEGYYIIQCVYIALIITILVVIIHTYKKLLEGYKISFNQKWNWKFQHSVKEIVAWYSVPKFEKYTYQERNCLLAKELKKYNESYCKYCEVLKYNENIIESNIDAIYKEIWKNKINPSLKYFLEDNPQRGRLEDELFRRLIKKYPEYTKVDVKIGSYFPDILLDVDGIAYIDIEIDEPYEYKTGKAIHCIDGEDVKRNDYLAYNNYFIIRFAEIQIFHHIELCLAVIDAIVQFINTRDYKYILPLKNILPTVKRWTREQSRLMYIDDLRAHYNECDISIYKLAYEEFWPKEKIQRMVELVAKMKRGTPDDLD